MKPFDVAYMDTREEIANVANRSGLPATALWMIFKDFQEQAARLAESERRKYQEENKENEKKEEGKHG